MGIGVSIFLVAVGAILTFAVEANAEGIDINTVGIILMIVGGIGLLFSMLVLGNDRGRGVDRVDRERTVVRDREI